MAHYAVELVEVEEIISLLVTALIALDRLPDDPQRDVAFKAIEEIQERISKMLLLESDAGSAGHC